VRLLQEPGSVQKYQMWKIKSIANEPVLDREAVAEFRRGECRKTEFLDQTVVRVGE